MRRERAQRAQLHLSLSHALEHARKSPTHASRRDSPPSRAFTHSERFDTIREQRRIPQFEVQHALLEFDQVREQLRRQLVALPSQRRQPRQKFRIPQSPQVISVTHHHCLTREISSHALPLGGRYLSKTAANSSAFMKARQREPSSQQRPESNEHPLVAAAARRRLVNYNQHSTA